MYLQGNFYSRGKKYRLTLKDTELSWEPEGTPDCKYSFILVLIKSLSRLYFYPGTYKNHVGA